MFKGGPLKVQSKAERPLVSWLPGTHAAPVVLRLTKEHETQGASWRHNKTFRRVWLLVNNVMGMIRIKINNFVAFLMGFRMQSKTLQTGKKRVDVQIPIPDHHLELRAKEDAELLRIRELERTYVLRKLDEIDRLSSKHNGTKIYSVSSFNNSNTPVTHQVTCVSFDTGNVTGTVSSYWPPRKASTYASSLTNKANVVLDPSSPMQQTSTNSSSVASVEGGRKEGGTTEDGTEQRMTLLNMLGPGPVLSDADVDATGTGTGVEATSIVPQATIAFNSASTSSDGNGDGGERKATVGEWIEREERYSSQPNIE